MRNPKFSPIAQTVPRYGMTMGAKPMQWGKKGGGGHDASIEFLIKCIIEQCYNFSFDLQKVDGALVWTDSAGEPQSCPILGLTIEEICNAVINKIDPQAPVSNEMFCKGDTLPDNAAAAVTVCTTEGVWVVVDAGETLPDDLDGVVLVDEVNGKTHFSQMAKKPVQAPQIIHKPGDALPTGMAGTVKVCTESGVWVELMGGAVLPAGLDGTVHIDPITKCGDFVQSGRKPEPKQKWMFCAGEELPDDMTGEVVIHLVGGGTVALSGGDTIPVLANGVVIIDPVTRKPHCVTKPDAAVLPEQETFKAGQSIPADADCPVEVCLTDGDTVSIAPGDALPTNIDGSVHVDEVTKKPVFIQRPVKLPPALQSIFKPGQTIPQYMTQAVMVCLSNGETVQLQAGSTAPTNMVGQVIVDAVTGCSAYAQGAIKLPEPVKPAQGLFCATDDLPAAMCCPVSVLLKSGAIVELQPKQAVPATICGKVYVDTCTGQPAFIQDPVVVHKPRKQIFKPGDSLPSYMTGQVSVCSLNSGITTISTLQPGDDIPANVQGCIAIDPTDGVAGFMQFPVKIPAPTVPEQEIFKPGGSLPASMLGTVTVCLDDKSTVILGAGDDIPANAIGCVLVDESTNRAAWTQDPVKPGTKNYVCQAFPPTAEQIADGICIWRNDTVGDMCLYTINKDGVTWFSSDKQLTDTFTTQYVDTEAGTDDRDIDYPANSTIMVLASGFEICIPAKVIDTDTDTFAFDDVAGPGESGVDIFGTAYGPGDDIIRLASGQVYIPSDEIGPAIAVDPADPSTFPANSGDFEKQCLVDAAGKMVGFVDATGSHLIQLELINCANGQPVAAGSTIQIITPATTAQQGMIMNWPGYANPEAVAGDADFCMPVAPTYCPGLPRQVCDEALGVTWHWNGSAWSICGFCPMEASDITYSDPEITTLDDAALANLLGAGRTTIVDITKVVANETCLPMCLDYDFRTVITSSMYTGNYAQLYLASGPGHTAPLNERGAQVNVNTTCNRLDCFQVQAWPDTRTGGKAVLQPGQSVTLNMLLEIGFFIHRPFALNTIGAGSNFIECHTRRTK